MLKDHLGVSFSKPKYHIINFYFDHELIHRVFEPTFKRHVFVPMKGDWIEIHGLQFEVTQRKIKYLDDRLVATVYLDNVETKEK